MLDVSGNDAGNFGARLLAKALQINASLHTLRLDGNQITAEGYADIAHALKENFSVVSVPFPVQDCAEAVARGEKDKTQLVLSEIEKMTRRNLHFGRKSSADANIDKTDLERTILAHSRLTLGNIEEELNKVVYGGQQALQAAKEAPEAPEIHNVRSLMDEAELSKKCAAELEKLCPNGGFLDDLVAKFAADVESQWKKRLASSSASMLEVVESCDVECCTDNSDFMDSLRELANRRSGQVHISAAIEEFKTSLRQQFNASCGNLVHALAGGLYQEVAAQLSAATKILTTINKSSSQGSLTTARASPSGGTPKSRKQFFHRIRPKSIVGGEGVPGTGEAGMADASSSEEFNPSSAFDSSDDTEPPPSARSKLSSQSCDSTVFTELPSAEGKKLQHLQKERPKNPMKRRPPTRASASLPDTDSQSLFAATNVTGTSKDVTAPLPTVVEVVEPATAAEPRQPLITSEMIQKALKPPMPNEASKGLKLTPPKVPPNTPITPQTKAETEQHAEEESKPPPLPPKTHYSTHEERPKLPTKPKPQLRRSQLNSGSLYMGEGVDDKESASHAEQSSHDKGIVPLERSLVADKERNSEAEAQKDGWEMVGQVKSAHSVSFEEPSMIISVSSSASSTATTTSGSYVTTAGDSQERLAVFRKPVESIPVSVAKSVEKESAGQLGAGVPNEKVPSIELSTKMASHRDLPCYEQKSKDLSNNNAVSDEAKPKESDESANDQPLLTTIMEEVKLQSETQQKKKQPEKLAEFVQQPSSEVLKRNVERKEREMVQKAAVEQSNDNPPESFPRFGAASSTNQLFPVRMRTPNKTNVPRPQTEICGKEGAENGGGAERKSVIDLKSMFEKGPAEGRPAVPPRPSHARTNRVAPSEGTAYNDSDERSGKRSVSGSVYNAAPLDGRNIPKTND